MKLYLAVSLFLISHSAFAGLYKWVDENGAVHYSDSVPASASKSQTLRRSTAPAEAATDTAAPKSFAEQQAEVKKAERAKAQAAEMAAKEKETAAAQQQNCQNAKERLITLQNAPRIASYNEAGEPVIMGDDERQKKMDEANKIISKYCK